MSYKIDLSVLDHPKILQIVFHPHKDLASSTFSHGISDYFIEVERGVTIACRFYKSHLGNPSLLYFHGNAETVGDHDDIASIYNQREIDLFVADYRGYGLSNGRPTITNMFSDAHVIFQKFKEIIAKEGYKKILFIMGRSLGSMPAIDLALHHQNEIKILCPEE